MKNFNNEIEQLFAIGRGMSDTEFDTLLDIYLGDKTDAEKQQIGVVVLKTKISKFNKIKQIDNEIKLLNDTSLFSANRKNIALKVT